MFIPHKLEDEQKLRFYQTPKVLFTNDKYKDLGIAEKQFYAILRDRQELSRKNKWVDENGNIYLIFTVKNLAELCNISTRTVIRYKKALCEYDLLYEQKLGQGKPNRIYVGVPDFGGGGQKYNPRSDNNVKVGDKSTIQGVSKVIPNDTEHNDTELNNNIYSSPEGEPLTDSSKSDKKKKAKQQVEDNFEKMWKLYPEKRGKGRVSYTKKKEIYKLGDEFERCIERYLKDVEKRRRTGFEQLQYKNGSTFFNSGYVDYLDENYEDVVKGEGAIEYDSSGKRIDHRGISVSGIDKDEAESLRQMAERIKQQGRDS